jgi:hypothetical protein
MAFYDAPLVLSSAQAITTTAASSVIYDVTGAGSGNAPSMTFGNGEIGFDIGMGDGAARPTAYFTVTTNGTGTGTVAFAVQAAEDNGSNAPGTYVTLAQTEAFVGTTLDVGEVITLPIPAVSTVSPNFMPRFYRFYYVQTGDGAVSVTGVIMLNPPSLGGAVAYGNNFNT